MKRLVRYLAILYLLALLVLWGFIHFDQGTLWPVTLFLFSPRWVVAVPLFILVPLTLAFQLRLTFAYLLHGLIIVFPIMDCRISWVRHVNSNAQPSLRIMTCNLGGGSISTDQFIALARSGKIHLLVLQECPPSLSKPVFEQLGWVYRQESNIAIGSCFDLGEMQILVRQPPSQYNVIAAVCCELHLPVGLSPVNTDDDDSPEPKTVRIVSVHLPTFRPAFEKGLAFDLDAGAAIDDRGIWYGDLAGRLLQQVKELDAPTVIAGDFNVPVESAFYRDYWSSYQNALSNVGSGLRYTKYTRFHGIRIDHVLTDGNWSIESAAVGPDLGGDHRPVIVDLALTR